jgi:phage terminase large subunit-like protein
MVLAERTQVATVRAGGREFFSTGQRVIDFIQEFCCYTDGDKIGQPAQLQPWQKKLLLEMFEVESQPDGGWLRRYRRALIGIPKKNGKSQMAAWLAVYFTFWDGEPSALVVCGANSDEQADIVFDAAKKTCELSPALAAVTTREAKRITAASMPGARLLRVSKSVGSNDGKHIHAAVLDEIHEMTGPQGRAFHTVIAQGIVGRRQPFVVQITTAGVETDAVWYEQYDLGRRMEAGETEALDRGRSFFFRWFEAPKDLDYRSYEAAKAANPSLDVTVTWAALEDEHRLKLENEYRRYNLNQHTETFTRWLPDGAWEACAIEDFDLQADVPTWAAVDASTDNDTTAVLWGQWWGDIAMVRSRIWERPLGGDGRPIANWQVLHTEVAEHINALFEKYRLQAVPYDPSFITWPAQNLMARGVPMLKHPQTNERMTGPTKGTGELVLTRRIRHNGDPVLARHIKNAIPRMVDRGGIRLTKKIGRAEDAVRYANDGAVALVMLIGAMGEPPEVQAAPGIFFLDAAGGA